MKKKRFFFWREGGAELSRCGGREGGSPEKKNLPGGVLISLFFTREKGGEEITNQDKNETRERGN